MTAAEMVIAAYKSGLSREEIAHKRQVGVDHISNILCAAGLLSLEKKRKEIVKKYQQGASIKDIANEYGYNPFSVRRILQKYRVIKKSPYGANKGGFTSAQKAEIIRLYVKEHRGKQYIGKLFERADFCISYWLRKWGIKTIPRSIISARIREIYGPTAGFTGHTHKQKSKSQISKTEKHTWANGSREATIGKSRTYTTIVGNVLGTYEVAYLQQLLEQGRPLPKVCHKKHQTPYGTYKPDFKFDSGQFIEVKSKFTLRVAKGEMPQVGGTFSDNQFKKIKYFQKRISPLKVVVIENKKAIQLFKRAKLKGGVLDLTNAPKLV